MKILFKNARIIKMDDSPILNGDVLIDGNKIEKVSESINSNDVDKIIDCDGKILLPGFKNAHAHSAMTFLRGGGEGLNLQDWLFTYCFPREDHLIPSDVYTCSKVAFVEYIQGGITSSLEQYYFPIEIGRAATDVGFRTVLQGCTNAITDAKKMMELYYFYNSNPDSIVTYQVGCHSEYTLGAEEKAETLSAIKEHKVPFFTHISETKKEVDECIQRHGMSPVEFFDKNGFWDYGGGGYHCNYFSDEDIKIFKEKKVSIITNPGSNKYLNSGVCPVKKYFDLGFEVAVGTDGPASNIDLDMFYEMRLIKENNPDIPSYEILKMATKNGAKAMRIDSCDSLVEGKKADIIMLDSSVVKENEKDTYDAIVVSGSKDLVKMTMIDGKILYEDGNFFINEEVSEIYKNCHKVTERIDKEIKEC